VDLLELCRGTIRRGLKDLLEMNLRIVQDRVVHHTPNLPDEFHYRTTTNAASIASRSPVTAIYVENRIMKIMTRRVYGRSPVS
jgi:hypothetical protein